jgi:hypothetical protein
VKEALLGPQLGSHPNVVRSYTSRVARIDAACVAHLRAVAAAMAAAPYASVSRRHSATGSLRVCSSAHARRRSLDPLLGGGGGSYGSACCVRTPPLPPVAGGHSGVSGTLPLVSSSPAVCVCVCVCVCSPAVSRPPSATGSGGRDAAARLMDGPPARPGGGGSGEAEGRVSGVSACTDPCGDVLPPRQFTIGPDGRPMFMRRSLSAHAAAQPAAQAAAAAGSTAPSPSARDARAARTHGALPRRPSRLAPSSDAPALQPSLTVGASGAAASTSAPMSLLPSPAPSSAGGGRAPPGGVLAGTGAAERLLSILTTLGVTGPSGQMASPVRVGRCRPRTLRRCGTAGRTPDRRQARHNMCDT